jgi:hypothetical protein
VATSRLEETTTGPEEAPSGPDQATAPEEATTGEMPAVTPAPGTAVPIWRRRWAVVAAVCTLAAAVAISPLSPISPFDGDHRPEAPGSSTRSRIPETTRRDHLPPRPEPTLIPPATVVPPTTAPAPTAPPTTVPVPAPPPTPAPIQGAGYHLAYADEFDGGGDGTWENAPFGGSLPASVGGGVLTLEATVANDRKWGYVASTGSRADREPSYAGAESWQTGYFEARIRYTDSPWSLPAFWLFSMAKTEAWPNEDCSKLTSEWDIMENNAKKGDGRPSPAGMYHTALHRNTKDGTDDGYCGTPDEQRVHDQDLGRGTLASWHTWGGLWTHDQLCTYIDGQLIQCMEPWDTTAQPMHLVLVIGYRDACEGCPAGPPALRMDVDWVRVWQAG